MVHFLRDHLRPRPEASPKKNKIIVPYEYKPSPETGPFGQTIFSILRFSV